MAGASLAISGVLLVDDLCVADMDSHTEFHVDCLALSVCGDLIPIGIYDFSSDPDETARLQALLQPGNLMVVREAAVIDYFSVMRLHGPELSRFEGDIDQIKREFAAAKNCLNRNHVSASPDKCTRVRGRVSEYRILETKNAGLMAVATVETDRGAVEAYFFPGVFANFRKLIDRPGVLELVGRFEPQEHAGIALTLIVQSVTIPS